MRIIKSALIQMSLPKTEGEGTIAEIKEAMVQKHIPLIEEAGRQCVQILCFQEIFNTPYFCPGQDAAWYESAETVPGPNNRTYAGICKEVQYGNHCASVRKRTSRRFVQHCCSD
ncbi:MAG: nitrilase-related carbon-nitrogen hydrolase [Chitinophagaceae bacterium]